MAKNHTTHLLLPGESAWEFWSLQTGSEATLNSSHEVATASEIEKFPTDEFIFLFPLKALTALPLRVNTGDTSLFHDLAETHAERAGLRADPLAGQLTDIFPINVSDEQSTLLSVILRAPQPINLPTKSPQSFDISARAFSIEGTVITLWRELGQWVFTFHQSGKLLYFQTTASKGPTPDTTLIREIRIAAAQLSNQEIEFDPTGVLVWSSDTDIDTRLLKETLSIPVRVEPRPHPVLPSPQSSLLPADVRAARRAAKKRQSIIFAIAAMVLLYLGTIAYFGFDLWNTNHKIKNTLTLIEAAAPQSAVYANHIERWDEVEFGISRQYNTVDILKQVADQIPPNTGLRLQNATITPTNITLVGEAPQSQAVNQFSLKLTRNGPFFYKWQTPEPTNNQRGWAFTYTGTTESLANQ